MISFSSAPPRSPTSTRFLGPEAAYPWQVRLGGEGHGRASPARPVLWPSGVGTDPGAQRRPPPLNSSFSCPSSSVNNPLMRYCRAPWRLRGSLCREQAGMIVFSAPMETTRSLAWAARIYWMARTAMILSMVAPARTICTAAAGMTAFLAARAMTSWKAIWGRIPMPAAPGPMFST